MKFTVRMARTEQRIYHFEVEAEDEGHAAQLGYELLSESSSEDGEIMHAEEWCDFTKIKPRYEVRENRQELRVSVIDTETGESRADYEYNDPTERAQNLREAQTECNELNERETV